MLQKLIGFSAPTGFPFFPQQRMARPECRDEVLFLGLQDGGGRGFARWGWSEGRDSRRAPLPEKVPAHVSRGPEDCWGPGRKAEALSAVRLRHLTARSVRGELRHTMNVFFF